MAQPPSNPKVEELRLRLKADPKSRLFFPLAEELRKVQQLGEAEQVLRHGLTVHPTYLSAWVSLGRICREQGKNDAAVESLTKALVLDPGNVVAARLLADAYLALGEKVEAIKKYKLVHALLPADQDLETVIRKLDEEINAVSAPFSAPAPAPQTAVEPEEDLRPIATMETPFGDAFPSAEEPGRESAPFEHSDDDRVFADAATAVADEQRMEIATGDDEPMRAAHVESPFEESAADAGYSSDAFGIEQPAGMHIDVAPLAAEVPEPLSDPFGDDTQTEAEDFYAPASETPQTTRAEEPYVEMGIAADLPFALESSLAPPPSDDFAKTITMADLYAAQGLVDEARDIYEDILARDPGNESVRAKLEALSGVAAGTPPPPEEPDYGYDDEEPFGGAPAAGGSWAGQAPVAHEAGEGSPAQEARDSDGGGGRAPSAVQELVESWPGDASVLHEATESLPVEAPLLHDEGGNRADVVPVLHEEEEIGTGEVPVLHSVNRNREKIARLEQWLAKVGRREVGHVQ
jgi:tetratricopeptide (TPR) repeat protein